MIFCWSLHFDTVLGPLLMWYFVVIWCTNKFFFFFLVGVFDREMLAHHIKWYNLCYNLLTWWVVRDVSVFPNRPTITPLTLISHNSPHGRVVVQVVPFLWHRHYSFWYIPNFLLWDWTQSTNNFLFRLWESHLEQNLLIGASKCTKSLDEKVFKLQCTESLKEKVFELRN